MVLNAWNRHTGLCGSLGTCLASVLVCLMAVLAVAEGGTTSIALRRVQAAPHSVPLRDYNNLYYVGEMEVAGATYTVNFDTGSGNVWLLETACFTELCRASALQGDTQFFDAVAASEAGTFWSQGQSLEVQYGSGVVFGFVGYAPVSLGGLSVSEQGLIAVVDAQGFASNQYDGLVGLGWQSVAEGGVDTILTTLHAAGRLDSYSFSMFLSASPGVEGELTLGGVNPSRFIAPLIYTPVTHPQYWMIGVQSLTLASDDTQLVPGGFSAIVDSGTSLLMASVDLEPWLVTLPVVPALCANVTWEAYPDIAFQIAGEKFTLTPHDYIVQIGNQCAMGIDIMPPIAGAPQWILGDVFARAFYVHYDLGDRRIGFAKLADQLGEA